MNFIIPKDFARRIVNLSWGEIQNGLNKKWLHSGVAVDKALHLIQLGEDNQILLELACLSDDQVHEIKDKVQKLAVDPEMINNSRLAKIALALLFENQTNLTDPLLEIEKLYADTNYPECMSHLVRYMPNDDAPRNLIEDWKNYVNQEVYGKEVFPPK